jgi:lipopolysaccharide transport system permease protein
MTAGTVARRRYRVARQQWDVLLTLALAQFRDRYGRGNWQLVKWLLDPYAATGVYLTFVVFIVDRGGDAPGLVIACAVIPFQLFLSTIFNSLRVVSTRGSLIQHLNFRRDLLPASVTLTESIGFVASLTLLPLLMAIYGIAPTAAIAWLPMVLAVSLLLALAAAYPATLFGVWYRELTPFALSAVRIMLFLAPGVVALAQVTGRARELLRLNPLTGVFEAYRSIFLYGESPAAWELVYPTIAAGLVLAVFVPVLRREQAHLAKVVV